MLTTLLFQTSRTSLKGHKKYLFCSYCFTPSSLPMYTFLAHQIWQKWLKIIWNMLRIWKPSIGGWTFTRRGLKFTRRRLKFIDWNSRVMILPPFQTFKHGGEHEVNDKRVSSSSKGAIKCHSPERWNGDCQGHWRWPRRSHKYTNRIDAQAYRQNIRNDIAWWPLRDVLDVWNRKKNRMTTYFHLWQRSCQLKLRNLETFFCRHVFNNSQASPNYNSICIAATQCCRARWIARGLMQNFMYFKTRLCIVFQHEATWPWALSFKLKKASSLLGTCIKEG